MQTYYEKKAQIILGEIYKLGHQLDAHKYYVVNFLTSNILPELSGSDISIRKQLHLKNDNIFFINNPETIKILAQHKFIKLEKKGLGIPYAVNHALINEIYHPISTNFWEMKVNHKELNDYINKATEKYCIYDFESHILAVREGDKNILVTQFHQSGITRLLFETYIHLATEFADTKVLTKEQIVESYNTRNKGLKHKISISELSTKNSDINKKIKEFKNSKYIENDYHKDGLHFSINIPLKKVNS